MARHIPEKHQALISWLKYFDIEYLDEVECGLLSELDANNPVDLKEAIRIAVFPEFRELNEISKRSLREILRAALAATDSELEPIFSRVGMPFQSTLRSKHAMLATLWTEVFNEAF